ncbi:oxidoreductase [Fragilaria crotonensis]|nr:oxidoreductase [Fragilaria crotonensis]
MKYKLKALPILEERNGECEPFDLDVDLLATGSTSQSPSFTRKFCDLLDAHKALVLSRSPSTSLEEEQDENSTNNDEPLSVQDFGNLVVGLNLTYYPYIGGAAPRTVIPVSASTLPVVFTANESPPDQPIPFHHELAQTPNPPEYIFFYCERPSETGGQTPLIDSTKVYRFVQDNHPHFLEKLKEHGVRYIRTLPPQDDPTSPLGRSYQNSWDVTTPQQLDEKLATIPGCEWKPSASMDLLQLLVAAFIGWQDSRNDRTKALRFGNNDPMDLDVLQSVADFMKENRVLYTWKAGDILAVQNRLVMHSREPFTGPRRVLASIWGPPHQDSVVREQPATALGLRPDSFFEPLNPSDPLVFGFWKVGKDVCEEVAYQAIANGYRRLDCACDYGNEEQVGRGIKRAISEGLVERKDLFITSKLWNTYHKPEHVLLACQKSLEDLGLEYLDEYLIHFPISMEFVPIEKKYPPEWTNLHGKWFSFPTICLLRQILSTCRIRPTTLQVELHPHNSQNHLIRFAREAGLHVTAFSVLGASSYLELNMANEDDVLLTNSVVTRIADYHRKTPAQILLRWALQRNTFPLSKTTHPVRMQENRNVFDFYLTRQDMDALHALNKNRRYNDPGAFCEPGMGTFCPIYE